MGAGAPDHPGKEKILGLNLQPKSDFHLSVCCKITWGVKKGSGEIWSSLKDQKVSVSLLGDQNPKTPSSTLPKFFTP